MNPNEPPKDEEAEKIVLGTLMHHPAAHAEAAEILNRGDFYKPAHQIVWDVISDRITEGKSVAPAALASSIQQLGQARQIKDGDLLWDAADRAVPGAAIGEFAEIVHRKAELREDLGLATAIQLAVANGADTDIINDLLARHLEARRERTTRSTAAGSVLDWDAFFDTDFTATRFLPGRIMAAGQQIAMVGDGKAGKSLFCQEWAWRMATGQPFLGDRAQDPIRILYVDAENGQDEIQRRMLSFGAGPGRMGELRYASFPPIPPLDTPAGGLAFMALVRDSKAELVFIDTVSRFISGAENDADTWLSLYRCSLMPLKRAGIASVRLDHFGKDRERGSRGSSAKTQDVDHVWELTSQGDGGLSLKRTHTRTGVGEELFGLRRLFQKRGDDYVPGSTRHVLSGGPEGEPIVPGSVQDIVRQLDEAGVDATLGRDRLRMECDRLSIKAANGLLSDVVRIRKHNAQNGTSRLSADLSPAMNTPTVPDTGTGQEEIPAQTCPGQVADSPGRAVVTPVPSASSLRRGQVGQPRPDRPLCTVCETPLAAELTAKGITEHVLCQ